MVVVGLPQAHLIFSEPRQGGWVTQTVLITLEMDGLKASSRCSALGLAAFFRSLADDWRGWEGKRVLTLSFDVDYALDPEPTLTCSHDGKGLVLIEARLGARPASDVPGPYEWDEGWSVVGSVLVEPGALESVATQLAGLLDQAPE